MATVTVYSSAGDGYAHQYASTWSACRGGTNGTTANYTSTDVQIAESYQYASDNWQIWRGFFPFDIATALTGEGATPADCTITAVDFVIETYGGTEGLVVVEGLQASTSQIVAGDFDACGAVAFAPYKSPVDDGTNTFTLNATGIAAAHAARTGWFKLCTREYNYDFLNSPPPSEHVIAGQYSEVGGLTRPHLNITYTTGPAGPSIALLNHLLLGE